MESPSTPPHVHTLAPTSSPSQSSASRCTQCNISQKNNTRNLVVCVDGTSNHFGHHNTNVVKLFAKIDLKSTDPAQFTYYSSGIGTSPKSPHAIGRVARAVSSKLEMVVAWHIEEIVKDAYSWLAQTHQEGDQMYLFGFSRGAYQVRVLAEMIHEVGLIRTPTDKQVIAAYDHYEAVRSGKPKITQIAREFKNTFSWQDVGVHFIGGYCFLRGTRKGRCAALDTSAVHACHFRHALALDELRVKFMPEYFHEVNSQIDDVKSKYITPPLDIEHATTPTHEAHQSPRSDNGIHSSEGVRRTKIKEVWFAGSHSDVGGKHRSGESHQSGNVSLLWMRREAAEKGLVLHPTDIVWVPDDLDFGIKNSMTTAWRAFEYLPIKHQVSFSGAGEDSRRWHILQPRRIIPGQKVHASVLFANAYRPLATLGEGFEIPISRSEIDDLDNQFWETGLFDDTAAQVLVDYLSNPQGVPPICLDRLLFMLQFKEGKRCLQQVRGWKSQFQRLIHDENCTSLVRLVTIVAYYEASWDSTKEETPDAFSEGVYENIRECLKDVLAKHKHRDSHRVLALLRPLMKHPSLRERILTKGVLEELEKLLDKIVAKSRGNFGQAMDGLSCLLECEDTQEFSIAMLAANFPDTNVSRLFRILEVNNPHLLATALRMVLALVGIPKAKENQVWTEVKPRIRQLARKKERLVGLLAVEILLALYDPNDREQLNIRNPDVRANLVRALFPLNTDRRESNNGQSRNSNNDGRKILQELFGMGTETLSELQKRLIAQLKIAVKTGNVRERTAATLTLLKLCETSAIRHYLGRINLFTVFIKQLHRKESALLAAYALAVYLKYEDMQLIKENDDFARKVVNMLRLDYFDDAVGDVEGFQVFGDLMQHHDLRDKIMRYDITEVIKVKLERGKAKEARTSLICLEIFRFFDQSGSRTTQLVETGLMLLQSRDWKSQKAGVTVLSALAQTKNGVEIIKQHIHKIVGTLLPQGHLPIDDYVTSTNPRPQQSAMMMTEAGDLPSQNSRAKPPSWMMGPACALRILAQNETLRERTRETIEYGSLKHLHLSGTLVDETDTLAFQVWTPNRTDVVNMLDKVIKAVDGELSEDGLMSIGDTVLPHIRHSDRLWKAVRSKTVKVASIIPLLGVSVLAILALIVAAPIFASVRLYEYFRVQGSRYQDGRILNRLLSGSVQ